MMCEILLFPQFTLKILPRITGHPDLSLVELHASFPLISCLCFLFKKRVILKEKALLEATGADAVKEGGGGGGGVIAIYFTEGLVGVAPTANQSTKGGNGTVPGDNGLVVINGMRTMIP